jgi:hypothetical protein
MDYGLLVALIRLALRELVSRGHYPPEVPDFAGLSHLHVAEGADGTMVYVAAENDIFVLQKASAGTADGTDYVAPSEGSPIAGGRTALWVRMSVAATP